MTHFTYQDFDLLIEETHDAYRARVVRSPAGEAKADFELPFSEGELRSFFWLSGRNYRSLRFVGPDEAEAEQLTPQEFGSRLYEAVFGAEVGTCLQLSLQAARQAEAGLRVRLRLDRNVPELADLPWEYLSPEPGRFLALSDRTVIARYIELTQPPEPLRVMPPLRILGIVSEPSDVAALNVEQEWGRLQDALADLQASGLIILERLEAATLPTLLDRLRGDDVHILHYIGHGYFDEDEGDKGEGTGGLVLEDKNRESHFVDAARLSTVLRDHEPLRLVFLNACEGARSGQGDFFAGTAQQLVWQETPAVIAMQFEVSDRAAVILAQEFYEAIADGYPVDAALAEARKAVYAEGDDLEWGTPVLFSRADDNQIIELPEFVQKEWKIDYYEPETVFIPAGPFQMGSEPGQRIPDHETPLHEADLDSYRIGKYPVTNEQYAEFINDIGCAPPPALNWLGCTPPPNTERWPVAGVTWYDAMDYCEWLSEKTGRSYTLPTEAEWEKVARGTDGRLFPWGNDWQPDRCNINNRRITPVDAYPDGVSPNGCFDMVGNVPEWTLTLWGDKRRTPDVQYRYPWQNDGRNNSSATEQIRRVYRSGARTKTEYELRCALRGPQLPRKPGARLGFRVLCKEE